MEINSNNSEDENVVKDHMFVNSTRPYSYRRSSYAIDDEDDIDPMILLNLKEKLKS